jgi:hypothetical protein
VQPQPQPGVAWVYFHVSALLSFATNDNPRLLFLVSNTPLLTCHGALFKTSDLLLLRSARYPARSWAGSQIPL